MSGSPLLAVEDLTLHYATRAGDVCAVDNVSLTLDRGQSLGLVGESGCGKSSLALALLRLQPDNARVLNGKILLDGVDLLSLSAGEMRTYRWNRIAMVFQSAMNALDPVYRVGDQIIEALEQHVSATRQELLERVHALYELVNLNTGYIRRYPHEYSGGMKQRAIIAMALACEPDLIIADEPTTALDVIVQDHILRELQTIRQELNMSMLYISHDMAVIAEVSDVVAVMYAGKIVEYGSAEDVFKSPIHPYTRALMSAFPSVTGEKHELATLGGEPPNPLALPSGCHFHPRCPFATAVCTEQAPPTVRRGEQWADCWNPPEDQAND